MGNKVKFKKRPKCSCGAKMKVEKIITYYHTFYIWTCDNCNLESELEKYDPDKVTHLGYG